MISSREAILTVLCLIPMENFICQPHFLNKKNFGSPVESSVYTDRVIGLLSLKLVLIQRDKCSCFMSILNLDV